MFPFFLLLFIPVIISTPSFHSSPSCLGFLGRETFLISRILGRDPVKYLRAMNGEQDAPPPALVPLHAAPPKTAPQKTTPGGTAERRGGAGASRLEGEGKGARSVIILILFNCFGREN